MSNSLRQINPHFVKGQNKEKHKLLPKDDPLISTSKATNLPITTPIQRASIHNHKIPILSSVKGIDLADINKKPLQSSLLLSSKIKNPHFSENQPRKSVSPNQSPFLLKKTTVKSSYAQKTTLGNLTSRKISSKKEEISIGKNLTAIKSKKKEITSQLDQLSLRKKLVNENLDRQKLDKQKKPKPILERLSSIALKSPSIPNTIHISIRENLRKQKSINLTELNQPEKLHFALNFSKDVLKVPMNYNSNDTRDPTPILANNYSELTTSNDASNNFNSHIVSETQGPHNSSYTSEIKNQQMVPGNWRYKPNQYSPNKNQERIHRKKFDSETETNLSQNPKLNCSQPLSSIKKKAEFINTNLRAKSPQFDLYRNQLGKKPIYSEIQESQTQNEKIIEISEEISKKEPSKSTENTLVPLYDTPKSYLIVPVTPISESTNPNAKSLSDALPLSQNHVSRHKPVSFEFDQKQPDPKSYETEKHTKAGSVDKNRNNFEKFITQNAFPILKDKLQIPIIPSKYLTHNPRLFTPLSPNLSENNSQIEFTGKANSYALVKSPDTNLEDRSTSPATPSLITRPTNFSPSTPDQITLNDFEKISGFPEINSNISKISKLENNCKRFPKFDKATSIVKNFGKIVAFAANTHKGKVRKYNEDRVSVLLNAQKKFKRIQRDSPDSCPKNCAIFSIFDGHGGNSCCNFLKDKLHSAILEDLDIEGLLIPSIKPIYKNLDEEYQLVSKGLGHNISGSCAITVIVLDESIILFNVGDSRGILLKSDGKTVHELSIDHKPDRLSEFSRIIENGGELYKVSSDLELFKNQFHFAKTYKDFKAINEAEKKNPKLIFGPWRVKPGSLSVSRTFGDIEAKLSEFGGIPGIVIAEPDVFDFDVNDTDFLVLACLLIS